MTSLFLDDFISIYALELKLVHNLNVINIELLEWNRMSINFNNKEIADRW